jgi:RimJ/RimL family protein N-acetyltransferase
MEVAPVPPQDHQTVSKAGRRVGLIVMSMYLQRSSVDDLDDLVEMFEQMSPESRHRRFLQAMPEVRRSIVRRLCDVDQVHHRAWLARAGGPTGPVIGEVAGATSRHRRDRAEIAVSVRDDWAGHGVGRRLVAWMLDDLEQAGVTSVMCDVLPDNRRSVDLFSSFGFRFRYQDGLLVGERSLVRHGHGTAA